MLAVMLVCVGTLVKLVEVGPIYVAAGTFPGFCLRGVLNADEHGLLDGPGLHVNFPMYNTELDKQTNKNTEEWMGRIRIMTIVCNYKEIDRQLEEQFIYRFSDSDMLAEIIKELIKLMKIHI